MKLSALAAAFALALAPALVVGPDAGESVAQASVSRLLSMDELVSGATHVVVATAVERTSVWEEIGGARRIVTYTRLDVERTVLGAAQRSVWVRTLGGSVGKVGQSVAGEAQLTTGEKALLFLFEKDDITVVAGRAQGHFPISSDAHLRSSPDVGGLVPARGPAAISAREALVGAHIDTAVARVLEAKAAHAR